MNLKLFAAVTLGLLASPAAQATPVLYTFSGSYAIYSLGGVHYPPPGGLPYTRISIGFLTDTNDFTTHHYDSSRGDSVYFSDTIGTATVYDPSGKIALATITDPLDFRIYYPNYAHFTLEDVGNNPSYLSSGQVTYFGQVTDISGVSQFAGYGYATRGLAANTSAGLLLGNYTDPLVTTQLLPDPSPVPEPSTLILLATGSIAAAGALRRRPSPR